MQQMTMNSVSEELDEKTHGGRTAALVVLITLGVLLLSYLGLCAYASHTDTLFPGLSVMDTKVGGLTAEQAAQRLSADISFSDSTTMPVSVTESADSDTPLPESDIRQLSFGDLGGVTVDGQASAQRAWDYCHNANFFLSGFHFLKSLVGKSQLNPILTAPALSEKASTLAQQLSLPTVEPGYSLQDSSVDVTVPRNGYEISPATLEQSINAVLSDFEAARSVQCPGTVLQAQPALTAQSIQQELDVEMKNAGYDSTTDSIIPEQAHAEFDVPSAQTSLDGAAPGTVVTIPAQVDRPAVTADGLREVLFRDLLGECTTHVGGSSGRKKNVQLSASAFNGKILNDREVFSYNESVGKRTEAKGYSKAPAYFRGETVMEVGGGVCQPSSTLYLACLRADLEITERYAHRYIPAYIPAGMDATVSWGGPDYKFTNNTGYPIRIQTIYHNSNLTIKIWGTNPDGSSVKMTNQWISTTPFKEVIEEDPNMAPGTQEVKVTPYTGHRYKTFRNRYDKDGKLISSTYEATSDYKARDKVIVRGPAVQPVAPKPNPNANPNPILPLPEDILPTEGSGDGGWNEIPSVVPENPLPSLDLGI